MGKVSATMNVEMRLEAGRVVVGIGLRNYKCSLGGTLNSQQGYYRTVTTVQGPASVLSKWIND